ncbi:hypothetical protein [Hydrogenophaga sp. 5NK40-0174]|uniref:hypothetical protein n=1 Tax=Hydrogenophaga sp. 5NK40-0174 TaxID=3127649 RepID=UPI0031029378
MKANTFAINRRRWLTGVTAAAAAAALQRNASASDTQPLVVDHVSFPVYNNNAFLDAVAQNWTSRSLGPLHHQPQNPAFKAVSLLNQRFYVEVLSNTEQQPYWSNQVYLVVDKALWKHYRQPAMATEHFLVPAFGCGYSLVSPDFPHLNSKLEGSNASGGTKLTLLISQALADALANLAGQSWALPEDGSVKVHPGLLHAHDMAVIDDKQKLVAPILQPNPLLREYL